MWHLGILVSQPGNEPKPSVVGVQILNHWTAREVLEFLIGCYRRLCCEVAVWTKIWRWRSEPCRYGGKCSRKSEWPVQSFQAGASLAFLWKSKEASVTEKEWAGGKEIGGEVKGLGEGVSGRTSLAIERTLAFTHEMGSLGSVLSKAMTWCELGFKVIPLTPLENRWWRRLGKLRERQIYSPSDEMILTQIRMAKAEGEVARF